MDCLHVAAAIASGFGLNDLLQRSGNQAPAPATGLVLLNRFVLGGPWEAEFFVD